MARLNTLLVTGLSRFLNKVKATQFEGDGALITNLDPGNLSTVVPVAKGGTGKTTGVDAANYLINSLTTGSSAPTDNDYYVAQYAGGGSTTTTYHRRPVSALWSYIKGKIDAWKKNNTTVGALGWSSSSNDVMPITSNTLAYWNGAYRDTSSNLTYCNQGAFGAATIKNVDTSISDTSSTNLPTTAAIANYFSSGGTVNGALDIQNQLSANSATFGNLLVNGDATFTNGIAASNGKGVIASTTQPTTQLTGDIWIVLSD